MKGALLCILILSTACAAQPQARLASFIESEYAPYSKEGTASIAGEAFIKMMDGSIRRCAGFLVHLNPVTTYSKEWFERRILARQPLQPADPRAVSYHRETMGDSAGRFEFKNLPSGEYYLICQIPIHVPIGYGNTIIQEGIAHSRGPVQAHDGERAEVILTN